VTVPSDTLTPIWGITTSTAVPVLTAGFLGDQWQMLTLTNAAL
jgi:hypothetical protein